MGSFTLLAVFACVSIASCLAHTVQDEQWYLYKQKYNKDYKTPEEEYIRRLVFLDNHKKIETHNVLHSKGLKSFSMGVNQFTDMTLPEYRKIMLGFKGPVKQPQVTSQANRRVNTTGLPKEVDWVKKGYVTGVKNQGQCGSCWSFSTTGATEGAHFKKTGKLVSLSEQNLIDCASKYGAKGCDGGTMEEGFNFIIKEHGVDTEKSYPYVGKVEKTCYDKTIGATLSSFKEVEPVGDELSLQEAVAKAGPVSGAIDASKESFQSYQSGVYDEPDCSSTQVNHAILIVGYGVEDGLDYWLVKNSYGTDWGDKGYIKMSRNYYNQCGIATQCSYPIA